MKYLFACVLLFAGIADAGRAAAAPSPPGASLQPGDAKIITQFISALARKEGGEVPEEVPRTVRSGDMNHDGALDVAVLFTIEVRNGYNQYLAVFLRTNGKLAPRDHAIVGGKAYRAVKLNSVQDDAIHLSTTSYTDNDPTCCPTVPGTTQYILVNNKLKELPRSH